MQLSGSGFTGFEDVQDKDSRDVSSIFFTNSKSNRTKNPVIIVAFIFSITKLM